LIREHIRRLTPYGSIEVPGREQLRRYFDERYTDTLDPAKGSNTYANIITIDFFNGSDADPSPVPPTSVTSLEPTMAIAITTFLLVKVVPTFKSIYDSIGQKLPAMTQVVIVISHNLSASFLWIVGGAFLLFIGFINFIGWMDQHDQQTFHLSFGGLFSGVISSFGKILLLSPLVLGDDYHYDAAKVPGITVKTNGFNRNNGLPYDQRAVC
jgi:hypothetical protein